MSHQHLATLAAYIARAACGFAGAHIEYGRRDRDMRLIASYDHLFRGEIETRYVRIRTWRQAHRVVCVALATGDEILEHERIAEERAWEKRAGL